MQDNATIAATAPFPMPTSLMLRGAIAGGLARHATIQDQVDAGDAALAAGEIEVARLLYGMALIRRGFAGAATEPWKSIAARVGLRVERDDGSPLREAFGVDVARSELRELMQIDPELPRLADRRVTQLPDFAATMLPEPNAVPHRLAFDAAGVVTLVAALHDALCAGDVAALGELLDRIRVEIVEQPESDPADYASASLLEMAAAGVLAQLRDFFCCNYNLCWAPFGAPILFSACARLAHGALGPYLSGIGRLIRSVEDIPGLIELADGRVDAGRRDRMQRWLVLFVAHLALEPRVALAEQIGDGGLPLALEGMLDTILRAPRPDEKLLVAIRDAALECGWTALAARAQLMITRLSARDPAQWLLLADVVATHGATDAALAVLDQALLMVPQNKSMMERREALLTGNFAPFRVLAGIDSPPWRAALRARHRPAGADAPAS